MKKTHYIFTLILLVSTLFISCKNDTKKLSSSDDIGTYAFNILNDLGGTSEENYLQKLYTFEETVAYVKSHKVEFEQEFLDNFAVVTKANFNNRLRKDYQNLTTKATSFGIDWNNIKAVNFQYWPRAKYGVKSMKGDLFFTHDKQAYKVTVTAFEAGTNYFVTKIDNLAKVVAEKQTDPK